MRTSSLIIGIFLLAGIVLAEVPRDEELATLIVGKWRSHEPEEISLKTEYRSDGTASYSGDLIIEGKSVRIAFEVMWKVEGNNLIEILNTTINPDLFSEGGIRVLEILEIDATHVKYKNIDGDIYTEVRDTDTKSEIASILFSMFMFPEIIFPGLEKSATEKYSMERLMTNQSVVKLITVDDVRKFCKPQGYQLNLGGFNCPLEACSFWSEQDGVNSCTIIVDKMTNNDALGHQVRHCFQGRFH